MTEKLKWMNNEEVNKRYFECMGNTELMAQFRHEHPRYYLRARAFWNSKEHRREIIKERDRKYHQKDKDKRREYSRLHRLQTSNGETFYHLQKRPYTNYCEICGKLQLRKLKYHHWNKTNPSIGIWVCSSCHTFVEGCDKGYVEIYLQKKQQIEKKGGSRNV